MKRVLFFWVALALFLGSVRADETVTQLQVRLKQAGFYHARPNGEYDSETSAAVTRYQIRNGLAISGKMDAATLNALDVPPPKSTPASEPLPEPGTWRRLRNGDMQFLNKLNAGEIAPPKPPPSSSPRPAAAATGHGTSNQGDVYDRERLRDYVGAFVLAGLDPKVGAELEFFANRVDYFGEANVAREKIRGDLVRYVRRWPQRQFRLAGDLETARLPNGTLRVTFPLRYDVRNGSKSASGLVKKTLTLRKAGDGDLEIVGVNEIK